MPSSPSIVDLNHAADRRRTVPIGGTAMTNVRSVVVCGPPRSGTSLLTQIISAAGHTQLDQLIGASNSNHHGFCEDIRINRLNDDVLAAMTPTPNSTVMCRRLGWLGSFEPRDVTAGFEPEWSDAMRGLLPPSPFVVKDPRFSYTLPAFESVLGEAVVVVAVRPATHIATSLSTMVRREPRYFEGLDPSDRSIAATVASLWSATFESVLSWATSRTYLVDIADLAPVLPGLSSVIGTTLTTDAVDPSLGRSRPMEAARVSDDLAHAVDRRVAHDRRRLGDAESAALRTIDS